MQSRMKTSLDGRGVVDIYEVEDAGLIPEFGRVIDIGFGQDGTGPLSPLRWRDPNPALQICLRCYSPSAKYGYT